ncbi:DUF1642 domain-containing protein [Listeria monocytogenes]|nr:DUF1642 domain-containing protein [Listeria monocytogenes]EAE6437690.1 DUF1642 domain-containing protein [Listeria monocytogenes]EAG4793434.1 DUF1642 domain-containing protein [Listeria monocytogenes]
MDADKKSVEGGNKMKKFEVGERVQVIADSQIRVGTITEGLDDLKDGQMEVDLGDIYYYAQEEDIAKLDQPEPVVVPKFVAECIREYELVLSDGYSTKDTVLDNIIQDWALGGIDSDFSDWVDDNLITLIDAVRNGFVVEEEKKYYVRVPLFKEDEDASELVPRDKYLTINARSGESYLLSHRIALAGARSDSDWKSQLTEEQIKSEDERYWAFAVPVEEVEASE